MCGQVLLAQILQLRVPDGLEDFRWIPGAREAVAAFNRAGWLVIVVTNQSGVGRGYYAEDDVHALHARMQEDLAAAGARSHADEKSLSMRARVSGVLNERYRNDKCPHTIQSPSPSPSP